MIAALTLSRCCNICGWVSGGFAAESGPALISDVQAAITMTGNKTFYDAFDYLVNVRFLAHASGGLSLCPSVLQDEGYATNVINVKDTWPNDDNFSDDELTFLPFFGYLFSGTEEAREQIMLGLNREYANVAAMKSSLWNLIYASAYGEAAEEVR